VRSAVPRRNGGKRRTVHRVSRSPSPRVSTGLRWYELKLGLL
jgi:hypothetical protein